MQQPRRTSEFNEEPSNTNIRSRQQQLQQRPVTGPSPMPSTSKKNAARQSQVLLRRPSLERNSGANLNLLTVPSSTASSTKRRCTPHKSPSGRYEFPAEKRSCAGISFHNDKRWITEQTNRINEFIRSVSSEITGIGPDFFTRGGLRQMTVKQFVSIINYFLQFVGNRTSIVSSNHVEDIINILQKLNYPHQVNKSWLKTPITQSSFGHVIMLLDFLMEYVPFQQDVGSAEDFLFPLEEPHAIFGTCSDDDLHISDAELNRQTLRGAEEGFMLWDKNLSKDFKNQQLKTCESLILKRCGISKQELENLIEELKKNLTELEKKKIPESKYEEEQLKERKAQFEGIVKQIEELRENMNYNVNAYKQLTANKKGLSKEIENIEQKISKLKAKVNEQMWTVEEKNKQILEFDYLHHVLKSQERALDASKDKSHRKQVELSRIKKDLFDQVEKLNENLLSISKYSIYALPRTLNRNNIEDIMARLRANWHNLKTEMEANVNERQTIEKLNDQLRTEIKLYKTINCASVHDKLIQITSTLKVLETEFRNDILQLEVGYKNCTDALVKAVNDIEKDKKLVIDLKHEIEILANENEKFMSGVEIEDKKRTEEYELFLNRCEEQVDLFEALIKRMQQNDKNR